MLPDGRSRPNVTWQPASQVGFEAIGVASSRVMAIRAAHNVGRKTLIRPGSTNRGQATSAAPAATQ